MAGAVAPPKTAKTTVSGGITHTVYNGPSGPGIYDQGANPNYSGAPNLGPLFQQATDQANAAIQPQIDALNSQMAGADATARQRATDATNAGTAASSLISSLVNPVQGAFTAAAQNQELAGQGFSQGLQDALRGNTDNLNATLKSLGSPATLDSHAGEAGDVLYSLGGFNPGTSFAKQGASAVQGLADTASSANLLGQENAKSVRAQALLADQDFQNKIANVAAQLPGQIEDNYMKLQSLALDNKKFALAVQNQKFDQAMKIASQKLATAKYQTSVDEFNAKQTLSYAKLNQQARQFAVKQANSDRSYQIALAKLGISQKTLQMKVAAQEYKLQHGGFTRVQLAKFNSKLQQTANAIVKQTAPDGSETFFRQSPAEKKANKPGTVKTTYADFVKAAVANGAPLSMAIDRANSVFPITQRPTPQDLAGATGLSQKAASAAEGYGQLQSANSQATLSPGKGGKVVLATGPQGQKVQLQMPKTVTPALRNVVMGAVEYLGTPYAWGGESPSGFDCSGLAQYLYAKVGINIPRTTYDQFKSGIAVPKSQLQAGDLVFFKGSDSKNGLPGHVGIYIGNGQMIQAPHTGDVVKVSSVSGFPGYQGARRFVK